MCYRLSANGHTGVRQDTRVSHLRRIPPHRARPDADRRRTRPRAADATAAEGVRGREGATRPVARQSTHSLHLHRPKGSLTLCLHRLRASRDNSRRLGRAQSTTARENCAITRDTAQSRRRRAKQPRPRRRRRAKQTNKHAREDGQLYKILILYPRSGLVIAACGDYTKFLRDFV